MGGMVASIFLLCLLQPPAPVVTHLVASGQTAKRPSSESTEDSPNSPMTPAKVLKYQHEETLKDIDKMVKLATEVQEEVEKAGENVLPLNTLKKLDEVGRLARKIRGKLKQ
jgi:hypothetical protein